MVDLRTNSERIIRELKRGEHLLLSYRGEPVAELVPTGPSGKKLSPLEALDQAQEIAARDPAYAETAAGYLRDLRGDQQAWGEREPS